MVRQCHHTFHSYMHTCHSFHKLIHDYAHQTCHTYMTFVHAWHMHVMPWHSYIHDIHMHAWHSFIHKCMAFIGRCNKYCIHMHVSWHIYIHTWYSWHWWSSGNTPGISWKAYMAFHTCMSYTHDIHNEYVYIHARYDLRRAWHNCIGLHIYPCMRIHSLHYIAPTCTYKRTCIYKNMHRKRCRYLYPLVNFTHLSFSFNFPFIQ